MKRLTTISLIIFFLGVLCMVISGLLDLKAIQTISPNEQLNQNSSQSNHSRVGQLTFNMAEISKHNLKVDCWIVINQKVYDITSYFGSHPGGNGPMLETCGTEATAAYASQDPQAKVIPPKIAHSSKAQTQLEKYYIGEYQAPLGR